MIWPPMHSCSRVPAESASANASICLWTAYSKWAQTSGPCTSLWASYTRTLGFPPIPNSCRRHSAGFATRIPPGPSECSPSPSSAHACSPQKKPRALSSLASQMLQATRHLLEMYRRQLSNDKTRRRLHRLDKRLLSVASQLQRIPAEQNEGKLAG
jgi:hypothetical protein